MNKRNVFYWILYDFANSISLIIFYLYYSQWLVIDRGLSDLVFNLIFVGSSGLLLLTAPVLGLMADKRGLRYAYLKWITLGSYAFYLSASIIAMYSSVPLWLAVLCYLLANYFYLLSIVFYTPFLRDISPPEHRGFISGLGQFGNWTGQIAGLMVCLPLLMGKAILPGPAGRVQTFLPATLLYILLSLPMITLFKPPEITTARKDILLNDSGKGFITNCRELLQVPGIGAFLLSYFFFSDAILTISINFPIFLNRVWGISDKVKSLIMLQILVASALGSILFGWIGDRYGLKRVMIWVLSVICISLPVIATQRNFIGFNVSLVLFAIFFGAIFTVTRALLTKLCPNEKLNFATSFYVLFERFSTFIGPLVWGSIVTGLAGFGSVRYRWAFGVMTVFVVFGIIAAMRVPNEKDGKAAVLIPEK